MGILMMTTGDTRLLLLILLTFFTLAQGLGPAYGGDQFVRLKEIPPALVAARSSGRVSLSCSVTGSPTPTVAWYREGKRLAGSQESPGGLGETWVRLSLTCIDEEDAGTYECKGEAQGREVRVTTKVSVVGHSPHSGCQSRDRIAAAPTITGWHSTLMMQSGDTARLKCNIQDSTEKFSVIWRNAAGEEVKSEGRYKMDGTDLVISQASWADMGRFTCTAQNGFGVDMVSSFLYPLAPALYDYSS